MPPSLKGVNVGPETARRQQEQVGMRILVINLNASVEKSDVVPEQLFAVARADVVVAVVYLPVIYDRYVRDCRRLHARTAEEMHELACLSTI